MKTEEHLEAIAVFIQRVTAAVSELKDHLQQDYERTYPDLGEIIRIVLDEEEAKAWELSFFPHLFLPTGLQAPDTLRSVPSQRISMHEGSSCVKLESLSNGKWILTRAVVRFIFVTRRAMLSN